MNKTEKKQFRKVCNRTGLILIVYLVIMNLGFLAADLLIASKVPQAGESYTGIMYCYAVLLSAVFILLLRKEHFKEDFEKSKRPMTQNAFCHYLFAGFGIQALFVVLSIGMECLSNLFGYSMQESLTLATEVDLTIPMLIYTMFLGPAAEEILFRGFVIGRLKKYGVWFSIVVSSVLFGLFHGNLPQGIFAFVFGLLLGYVRVEYSIGWAFLIHMINNSIGVITTLLDTAFQTEMLFSTIFSLTCMISFFVMVFYLIRKRQDIGCYLKEQKVGKGLYFYCFTTWSMIFVILYGIVSGIMLLAPITA